MSKITNYFLLSEDDESALLKIESTIVESTITADTEITNQEYGIKIGDYYFGSLGNFSLILGKAKSKKTFLATLLATSVYKDESNPFKAILPKDKNRVIYIDTEQSKEDVILLAKRIKNVKR